MHDILYVDDVVVCSDSWDEHIVPNKSPAITEPLTNLLRKSAKFQGTEHCQLAFARVKAILTYEPVLAAPNFLRPFKLAADVCDVG